MKLLIPTLLFIFVTVHVPAAVISVLKSYRYDDKPVLPPNSLVRGEDGTLYGISHYTIFKLQPDGSGFSVLKQLSLSGYPYGYFVGRPAVSGNALYGMLSSGIGMNGSVVTVFKINTDGMAFTVLKTDLPFPPTVTEPGIVLSGETLYGWGFKLNTDGTGYTELAGFPSAGGLQDWPLEVQISGNHLFGATVGDGQFGAGTVFRLNTDGTGHTVLRHFLPEEASNANAYLTLVGDTLYGTHFVTTTKLFKLSTNGTGYHTFMEFPYGSPGELQFASGGHLMHSGGRFYFAGGLGGTNAGPPTVTVFSLEMDGTGYTVVKRFIPGNNPNPASQGYFHVNLLSVEGDTLYGMAQSPSGFEGEAGLDGRGGALFSMNTNGSSFTVLKEFDVPNLFPDGRSPGPLTVSDGVLYGADFSPQGSPRIFRVNTDGTGFIPLLADSNPDARVTVSGSTLFGLLYGRSLGNDEYSNARVFRMNTDGTGFVMLKEFIRSIDGNTAKPSAGMALSGVTLYGTIDAGHAPDGSPVDSGKVFKLNTDGTAYTILHTFNLPALDPLNGAWTNRDGLLGTQPSELTIQSNTLYGTAFAGGQFGHGTVFKLNTDGSGFTVLKHFTQETPHPRERLALAGDTLYGISAPVNEGLGGTVFRVNTDGTGFQVLKRFPDAIWDNDLGAYTNSEGVNPILGLEIWRGSLFGTTSRGGQFGAGTVFKVNTDGNSFTVLEHIERGGQPWDGGGLRGLVLAGSTLYGAAPWGGDQGAGGIYSISLTPRLSIGRAGTSLAVTWPSVWTDYVLQQNGNGLSSHNWSNVTDTTQDDGTNKSLLLNPTGGHRFYRLIHP